MPMHPTTKSVIESGMTVAQLIEALENCDPEAVVFFSCDYGDYSHTKQAIPIMETEELDSNDLRESAYSLSNVALVNDDEKYEDEDEEDKHPIPIVILT